MGLREESVNLLESIGSLLNDRCPKGYYYYVNGVGREGTDDLGCHVNVLGIISIQAPSILPCGVLNFIGNVSSPCPIIYVRTGHLHEHLCVPPELHSLQIDPQAFTICAHSAVP